MRSGVGLCVLGLLCLHSSVFGQEHVGVRIFCDDPSVEKAVSTALRQFNARLSSGYYLALFQILSASKAENGSDSVYSLQFTSRTSDCPAGTLKDWTDCNYLSSGHKMAILCNATVHMTETDADATQVNCLIDHIVPEKAACLGCPELIDENSEDLKVPLSVSVAKYNSMSDSTHLFSLNSVGYATRQVVAGFRFKVSFDMKKTTCAKAEHNDLNELCVSDEENAEFANCNSTVDVAPWRLEPPQAQIECDAGALPPTSFSRRRPPGWSPLRRVDKDPPTSGSGSPPPPQSPSKASAIPESSEEDITTSKPSASPDGAAEPGKDNPFHCPSKPWKPFHRDLPAAPTKATTEAASQPSVEGAFSDSDLLA